MGSCISLRRPSPSSPKDVGQGKHVISRDPKPHSKFRVKKTSKSLPSTVPSCTPSATFCSPSLLTFSRSNYCTENEYLWSFLEEKVHCSDKNSSEKSVLATSFSVAAPLRSKQPNGHKNFSPSPTLNQQNSFRREPKRHRFGTSFLHPTNLGPSSPCPRFHIEIPESGKLYAVTSSIPTRNLDCSWPRQEFKSRLSDPDRSHVVTNSVPQRSLKNRPKEMNMNSVAVWPSARSKENTRASPWDNAIQDGSSMKKTEKFIDEIDPGADNNAVGTMVSDLYWELPIDDIDNPLISLDCFLFL
ncbi:hypothetical protein IFM89_001733 [Coptis chinensis]|uniref:Uncharacterized protein n=1 Tax=Coptis chinensis TaxID=261450 RepID=A0A835HK51_9MAGN|nr:hypothetical protein IFM89_001733 [Coptis chinensis]